MILHLAHDNIFLDNFISMVEEIEDIKKHRFVVYNFDKNKLIAKNKHITYQNISSELFIKEISTNLSGVFLHCFSNKTLEFITKIPSDVPVYWCFWGNELFSPNEYFDDFLFDNDTKDLFYKLQKHKYKFLNIIGKSNFYGIYKTFDNDYRTKLKRLKRINYFCHFNKFDYDEFFPKYFKQSNYLKFFYSFKRDFFEDIDRTKKIKSQNKYVLIGHSGNYSNNHIEVFNIVKGKIPEGKKILCPISYGDKDYTGYILEYGKSNFKQDFVALTEYAETNKYLQILEECNPIIMNHYRTEAAGNVVMMLYLGKKVYMNPRSNFYKYLISLGVKVIDVYDIKVNPDKLFEELTDEESESNKKIIYENFSFEKSARYLQKILNP